MLDRKKDTISARQCGTSAYRRWMGRSLIPLNTDKIHAKIMTQYRRRRKVLERLEEKLNAFYRTEQPEYDQFRVRILGGVLTEERSLMEELSLLKSRLGKLQFVAAFRMMEPWQIYLALYERAKKVDDIWDFLENEVESCEKEKEKKEHELRERKRRRKNASLFFDDDLSPDELIKGIFDRMFGFMDDDEDEYEWDTDDAGKKDDFIFEDDFFLSHGKMESDWVRKEELKRIYRELCIKYHPDKTGCYDADTKRLWLEVQDAYRKGDLERLIAIRLSGQAVGNLESLSCSEILLMLDNLEKTIAGRRYDVKMVKKQDAWGFSKLSSQEKMMLAEKELNTVNMRCLRIQTELQKVKNCLQEILELSETMEKMR